jgi:hypothetical protein
MATMGRFRRAVHRLRALSLDRTKRWPAFVTIVAEDDFGPSVISIAQATVYPDGSVNAGGRWIVSERFGLGRNLFPGTNVKKLDGEYGFVLGRADTMLDVVSSLGPRAASLGRAKPGLRVLANSGSFALGPVLTVCGLEFGGVMVTRGAAYRVGSAVFARVPDAVATDASVQQFTELFAVAQAESSGSVYLMSDSTVNSPVAAQSFVDSRFAHESSGATLLAVNRMTVTGLASAVGTAASVTLESEALQPLTTFAPPTATVRVAELPAPRTPAAGGTSRFTQREKFDIDSALRTGSRLPRGVDIISRPDVTVIDTTVDDHRVFEDGRWRPQDPEVLRERSTGPWLISVKNAIVAPNGAVMLEDGTLLDGTYFGTPNYVVVVDGWVTSEVSERAGLALTRSTRFGHWLLQIAPRVTALSTYDESMTVITAAIEWNDAELLRRCGSSPERITRVSTAINEHLVRVPELVVPTHVQPESRSARSDPHSLNEFVTRFASPTATRSVSPRRVYFARDGESGERGGCSNRDELSALAEEFGYETVLPEKMSLDQQIDVVTSATEMLGEQGSALTWSMFMPPGSRLVMVQNKPSFHKDRAETYHNSVLAARGSSLHDIAAFRAGTSRNYEIEPSIVRRALETLR